MEQITGVDVSHFQGDVNWADVKNGHYLFAYLKCTGGLTFTDSKFEQNWEGTKAAGLLRGAYHFYYDNDDPTEQANHFLSVLTSLEATDLAPALDLEGGGMRSETITVEQYQNDVQTWLDVVEKGLGRKPIIYASPSFANKYLDNTRFAKYDLWLANYASEPTIPNAWEAVGYTIWQNTSTASVPGIEGHVDHDIFKGTLEGLQAL